MMNKLLYVFLFISVIGCKRNTVEPKILSSSLLNVERISAKIVFPDTVNINQKYDGEILFESHYDSIIDVFTNKEKNRYVFVSLALTENTQYSFDYLKTIVKDTFGALDNRIIPIHNLTFDKAGVCFIDGIINDAIFIDTHQKDGNGENLIRWLEDEVRVTKKVIVVNKDASK